MKGRRFLPAFLHVKRNFILMYKIQNPRWHKAFGGFCHVRLFLAGLTFISGLITSSIFPFCISNSFIFSRMSMRMCLLAERPSYSEINLILFSISSSILMEKHLTDKISPQSKLFYAYFIMKLSCDVVNGYTVYSENFYEPKNHMAENS